MYLHSCNFFTLEVQVVGVFARVKQGPVNSLTPGKFEWYFRLVIFKQILVIAGWGIFCEVVLIWMSLDLTDDQSTLVQVMAWCHQATSHYLSQCWPRSLSPYGVTRPQWVNIIAADGLTMQVRGSKIAVSCIKYPGIILCMCPVNGRRCYNVTLSLIGWAHTQNNPWIPIKTQKGFIGCSSTDGIWDKNHQWCSV